MTASQTRETHSVGGMIADRLRAAGHDVTVGKPSLEKSLDGDRWDHVFVGLGPLHGLGTSSMYGALGLIGTHAPDGKCTLFLDDLDAGKIGSGFRVMLNRPARLVKPFYKYKREHDVAVKPDVHEWLMKVVDFLANASTSAYPRMIVPSFTYDEAFRIASLVAPGAAEGVKPVDFSKVVPDIRESHLVHPSPPDLFEGYPLPGDNDWYWVTDHKIDSKPVRDMTPERPVFQCKEEMLASYLPDTLRAFLLPFRGWSPLYAQLLREGVPVTTHWRAGARIGPAFDHMAVEVEHLDRAGLRKLAREQRTLLNKVSPSARRITSLIKEGTNL